MPKKLTAPNSIPSKYLPSYQKHQRHRTGSTNSPPKGQHQEQPPAPPPHQNVVLGAAKAAKEQSLSFPSAAESRDSRPPSTDLCFSATLIPNSFATESEDRGETVWEGRRGRGSGARIFWRGNGGTLKPIINVEIRYVRLELVTRWSKRGRERETYGVEMGGGREVEEGLEMGLVGEGKTRFTSGPKGA